MGIDDVASALEAIGYHNADSMLAMSAIRTAAALLRDISAYDEQWRRLELVGTTDLDGNLLTLKALPDGTPLYRIKKLD